MVQSLARKLKSNNLFSLFPLQHRGNRRIFVKLNSFQLLLFLLPIISFAQWNPANPLIPAQGDCVTAYRICDVSQTYNFELIDDGIIDDANGSLGIPGMNKTQPTQMESKSGFIIFTPQFSGEFGLSVCPESNEDLSFLLFQNPNCGDLQTGNYTIITQVDIPQNASEYCTGIGKNPNTGTQTNGHDPYINIVAGNAYILFVSVEWHTQPGTHRFTLSFQGSVVTAHPDLFNYPGCTMSTQEFIKDNTKVFPNPFTNRLRIESETNFKTMVLYDVLGKQIINQPFVNEVNTSTLSQGVYFLHLIDNEGTKVVKKVIKN